MTGTAYTVFARKYRPQTFEQMIGQDVLIQTLSNAIQNNRVAHAYILTGVRGVGKTTTARLIARGLNCEVGPTTSPCGTCGSCVALSAGSHMDVIEIDAASRTGVDDMRELIEGVRYKPVKGRYKIYIIDEVHMLSKSAFNALLKTLEEPPLHAKFLFATTEIQKVPVTILSRCQRFDLKRVGPEILAPYFKDILGREGLEAEPGALSLISKAADGSVRDGLSLLDQAVSLSDGIIRDDLVKSMLGTVNLAEIKHLLDLLLRGEPASALTQLQALLQVGAAPLQVLEDLLSLIHEISVHKIVGGEADPDIKIWSDALSVPFLTRAWQLLLKGLSELKASTFPTAALEMLLIRFCYVQDIPLVQEQRPQSSAPVNVSPKNVKIPLPQTFQDMIALVEDRREALLVSTLTNDVHLVDYKPGHVVMRLGAKAPQGLGSTLRKHLQEWTGAEWVIEMSTQEGSPTLAAQALLAEQEAISKASQDPAVQALLKGLPGASIKSISTNNS